VDLEVVQSKLSSIIDSCDQVELEVEHFRNTISPHVVVGLFQ
jgi:hypothetical protein